MTRPGIEPRSPGLLANTLTPRPMTGHCDILSPIIYGRPLISFQQFFVQAINVVVGS